jgi:hypothetical protein
MAAGAGPKPPLPRQQPAVTAGRAQPTQRVEAEQAREAKESQRAQSAEAAKAIKKKPPGGR